MTTVVDLFQQAELAEAAYASFFSNSGVLLTADADVKAALRDTNNNGNFSEAQATSFVSQWKVVDQYIGPTSLGGLVGSGFSATLFRDTTTGAYTFALRGT